MTIDLVLVFTSPDRPGVVEELTSAVVEHGGNWLESRSARLCGDFAGIARVTIPADSESAFRSALEQLAERQLIVHARHAQQSDAGANGGQAALVLQGADHEGIVSRVAAQLTTRGINVEEMETGIEPAPTTGTPLFTMSCRLSIPAETEIEDLQAELDGIAQELGVDIELQTA